MYTIHAPAKVNLYLHVGPPRSDDRHPLDSLVVFSDARASDLIEFTPGGERLVFSSNCDLGPEEDNLVIRAIRALEAASSHQVAGTLHLEKRLPIAAGIGGGSSDAAAVLHLMNEVLNIGMSLDELSDIARPLGGDVPACVAGQPVLMRGDGDRVEPYAYQLPSLTAVLITPSVSCPTGPVFRKYDNTLNESFVFEEMVPPMASSVEEFCSQLSDRYRNDLQAPAEALHPEISSVLTALADDQQAVFSAMSGSGATCFALYPDAQMAALSASMLADRFSDAWAVVTQLGKAGFDPQGFNL